MASDDMAYFEDSSALFRLAVSLASTADLSWAGEIDHRQDDNHYFLLRAMLCLAILLVKMSVLPC